MVLFLLLFYNVTIHDEGIGVIEQELCAKSHLRST